MKPGILYVDSRVGSREFEETLNKQYRITTKLIEMPAADFAFRCGHTKRSPLCDGANGCRIGIERKTLSDLAGSLLKGRLPRHQIPDMLTLYAQSWIVIEGMWRPGPDDVIEEFRLDASCRKYRHPRYWKGQWFTSRVPLTYTQLGSWLVRFDVGGRGHLHRWNTKDPLETASFVAGLYRWWQKEYDKHQWNGIEKMPILGKGMPIEHAMMWRPTQLQKTLASLPGIGIKKAKQLGRRLGSIQQAMTLDVAGWREVGLGKADAVRVVAEITKRYR